MSTEIERKFLVAGDAWRSEATGMLLLRQGYLSTAPECAVRVRVSGPSAWLTIKGRPVRGIAPEFEYPIPEQDALQILDTLAQKPLIEKRRHCIPRDGLVWEVDEFLGGNAGLILAEIELADVGQAFSLPPWIGEEVTGDPRYANANLVSRPFSEW